MTFNQYTKKNSSLLAQVAQPLPLHTSARDSLCRVVPMFLRDSSFFSPCGRSAIHHLRPVPFLFVCSPFSFSSRRRITRLIADSSSPHFTTVQIETYTSRYRRIALQREDSKKQTQTSRPTKMTSNLLAALKASQQQATVRSCVLSLEVLHHPYRPVEDCYGLSTNAQARNLTPLNEAATSGNVERCLKVLSEDKVKVDQKDADGVSPLMHAASLGHLAICK